MNELEATVQNLNVQLPNPSGRNNFSVTYNDGWINCETRNNSIIKFNHSANHATINIGVVTNSVNFLNQFGEDGIRIGSCQGDPEQNTFEAFLRPYGQPHQLGSYFPSVLVHLGMAVIFRNGRSLYIRLAPGIQPM
jgi:hypothetical protein